MTDALAALRANRNSMLQNLENKLNESGGGSRPKDDTYWTLTRDTAGNGSAIIRFLPPTDGEDSPYVKMWNHAFKGPKGQWYIENSLTTLGDPDPVSEHNQQLWATEDKELRKLVSSRKRQLKYISNIYVVKDPAHPENEGKVFKYKYGQKIMDKINAAWKPEFDDQTPITPFDFWEGANLRLRVVTKDNFPNYDASTFDAPGPLFKDDDKIAVVWKQQYSLNDVVAPSEFKTYDELKKRFMQVIGEGAGQAAAESFTREEAPRAEAPKASRRAPKAEEKAAPKDEAEEDMSWFDTLQKELDED